MAPVSTTSAAIARAATARSPIRLSPVSAALARASSGVSGGWST